MSEDISGAKCKSVLDNLCNVKTELDNKDVYCNKQCEIKFEEMYIKTEITTTDAIETLDTLDLTPITRDSSTQHTSRERCRENEYETKHQFSEIRDITQCSNQYIDQRETNNAKNKNTDAIKEEKLHVLNMENQHEGTDNQIHSAQEPYKCEVCWKNFESTEKLIIHTQKHTAEKPHSEIPAELVAHKRSHTGEKSYVCNVCNKSFNRRGDFTRHKSIHSGEKPYTCNVCNKSFSRNYLLTAHKRTHTGDKPYVCDVCDRGFKMKFNLLLHKRTHTDEKPYICSVCSKGFRQRTGLVQHERTHTGEKPYVCELCNSRFSIMKNLTRHKRTHTGEKPYDTMV